MARRRMNSEEPAILTDSSRPTRIAATPLELDHNLMADEEEEEEEEEEDLGDVEEEIVRHRVNTARTLFRQPQSDNDTVNSTRSLYDTDIVYTTIHGRRYCGDWYMPNDQDEQDRQQMLHTVYYQVLGSQLTTVPLYNPEKILDVGTGTGEWAMAMGEEYPDAEVIGTDIAKIQPSSAPRNVFFEIDDAEEEGGWMRQENEFDLVHFRSMAGAFTDWSYLYRETFKHLKPGGWIEVIDFDDHNAFLSYFDPDSPTTRYVRTLNEAAKKSGRLRGTNHLQPQKLREVGFVNVSITDKAIPMGVWPEDKTEREIGKYFLVTNLCGIEAAAIRVITEQLGWDIKDLQKLCAEATEEIRSVGMDAERGHGISLKIRIMTGRKPGGGMLEVDEMDGSSTMGDSVKTITQTNGEASGSS